LIVALLVTLGLLGFALCFVFAGLAWANRLDTSKRTSLFYLKDFNDKGQRYIVAFYASFVVGWVAIVALGTVVP